MVLVKGPPETADAPELLLVTLVTTVGKAVVTVLALAGMISTLVRLATVGTPAAVVMLLMLIGKLLTADNGIALMPLI